MNGWWLVAALVAQAAPPQAAATPVPAQPRKVVIHGAISTLVATYPNQQDTRELRARALVDVTADPKSWLRLRFEGLAEGLVADRGGPPALQLSSGQTGSVIAAVRDAWAELRLNDVEVRAGYGRLVWGRLDEVMPSDVINPIDTARFFLDGRTDARLPVAFVRSRVFLSSESSIEAVVSLPGRRGRFDSLDETTSPFNLLRDLDSRGTGVDLWKTPRTQDIGVPGVFHKSTPVPVVREEPRASWRNLQGGLRVSTTAARVDMSVSAWRGFEGFGIVSFEPVAFAGGPGPIPLIVGTLVERYPRFTMIAGDAEMVRGGWAIRGEVAGFIDKTLNGPTGPAKGKAVDAGLGVDRAAGAYHLFGSIVWHREWVTSSSGSIEHLNVIASVDRRFSRERYLARVFGVFNPDDRSGFVRGLASWTVRDNVLLEASGGAFLGEGTDTIGRFTDRDFLFLRVRYSF
ncbi:MAG TPA: hypothetical protein VMZ90_00770 [Vicinamibacterales bacterium]|nr:hypothetical protein [Vicinamibacterales bacterium]